MLVMRARQGLGLPGNQYFFGGGLKLGVKLGTFINVTLADLEIVVDPGILDPSNKMQLAETFWMYSRCVVASFAKCQESCYFVMNITCKNKIGILYLIT